MPEPLPTPGPALECMECGVISEVSADDHGDECPLCGEYAQRVTITHCTLGEACQSADHHWGYEPVDGASIHVAEAS